MLEAAAAAAVLVVVAFVVIDFVVAVLVFYVFLVIVVVDYVVVFVCGSKDDSEGWLLFLIEVHVHVLVPDHVVVFTMAAVVAFLFL